MPISLSDKIVTKRLTLDLDGLSREAKTRAKDEAGRILVEEINSFLDRSTSPVSGGRFKSQKKDGTASLLFEQGDMRSSITFKKRQGNDIEVGVFNKREAPKAFNHNEGDTLPQRKFIPADGENFKRQVQTKVNQAIESIREQEEVTTPIVTVADLIDAFGGELVG